MARPKKNPDGTTPPLKKDLIVRKKRPAAVSIYPLLEAEQWVKFCDATGISKISNNYAVSNYGRVATFQKSLEEDGHLYRGTRERGFPMVKPKRDGKVQASLVHRLVAKYFIDPPKTKAHNYILHLDHDKLNNHHSNLAWATRSEMMTHKLTDPTYKRLTDRRHIPVRGHNLTEEKVEEIKAMLANTKENYAIRYIARHFSVSDAQIMRIKLGEDWATIEAQHAAATEANRY
jgi:hypothetical protein